MLRGTAYPVDLEESLISETEEAILHSLTDAGQTDSESNHHVIVNTERLSRTICLEVARWLRRQAALTVESIDW